MSIAPSLPARADSPAANSPATVWKRLARLIAAPGRTQVRLYDRQTGKFSDTGRLTESLPQRPAAVYLYAKGRTQNLVLDFDVKGHGAARVKADLDSARTWLTACGGAVVTDYSTNGGRHLICPLAIGTSASFEDMTLLARILASRLPTLDITPATNPTTGCISVPGSPDKDGGFRRLDRSLDEAVEAFTTRSAPDLIPRLHMLLGILKAPAPITVSTPPTIDDSALYIEGIADEQRLAPAYRRHDRLPDDVTDFAIHGTRNPERHTWQSNHQARMSVVVNAIARGYSLADLRELSAPGAPWHDGLGMAYDRYNHRRMLAMEKDFTKALHWYICNVAKSSYARHKENKNSPGGTEAGWRGAKNLRVWLANALAWADGEYAGKRSRWTVHAVLQCLAFYAHVAGEERSGTWVVGVGGRTLSIGCGLLSEDAVWRVLADLRERPGSPLVLVRRAIGTEADVYALTSQNIVHSDPGKAQRVRVEPVHPAWGVLGHHLRRVYELVAHYGLTTKADIYAAAGLPRASGDAMVTDLQIAGLLTKTGRGTVARGPESLDTIADRQHLEEVKQARLQRHRDERAAWRGWLDEAESRRTVTPPASGVSAPQYPPATVGSNDAAEHRAWQAAVMSHGPPAHDHLDVERTAIEIIAELLGGRIVAV